MFNVTDWETNNYNTHFAQYLKKQSQSYDEILSVKRIEREKYFLSKSSKK